MRGPREATGYRAPEAGVPDIGQAFESVTTITISLVALLARISLSSGEHGLIISGHQRALVPGPNSQPMRLKDAQRLLNHRRRVRAAKRIETDLR